MSTVLITGSAGLVGSAAARHFAALGLDVVGIDNDMRARFFGPGASTAWNRERLVRELGRRYRHEALDVRDREGVERVFRERGRDIVLVVHTAAQPSHDWAARDPHVDFGVNAVGTLVLLEATRRIAPDAVFIFTSTNKVYGDLPNSLPLQERETRWEIAQGHRYEQGIDESMSIDASKHSLFGASKVAADVLVQEYGRYFGMRTGVFRGGCLTGPAHSGTELHGFLAYLMQCTVTGQPYRVIGHGGKQVRDNIHAADLVSAFEEFFRAPRAGEVYNMGGSRHSHCSMREAITLCQEIAGRELRWTYQDAPRSGDHVWYVSDVRKFRSHFPTWRYRYGLREILAELREACTERREIQAAG